MATKTKSKTATKKPATHKPAKAAVSHKSAPKAKVEKKTKVESQAQPAQPHDATPAKKTSPHPEPETKAQPRPSLRREVETVSLIEEKKPRKKSDDGELKKKSAVLPPISRIRASLEATAAPPKAVAPAKSEPAPEPALPPSGVIDGAAAPGASETAVTEPEAEPQKVIHIKPPIIVKQLAAELGLKPHQVIAERQIEPARSRIALAPGPTTKLVVDSA